jgi:hypothetical protein
MKTTQTEVIMTYRGTSLEAKAARVAIGLFVATSDDPNVEVLEKLLTQAELEAWEEEHGDEDSD